VVGGAGGLELELRLSAAAGKVEKGETEEEDCLISSVNDDSLLV